ncbi:hypothetical protein BH11BAC2_BH11BAC2_21440 [soil metagenome]
MIRISTDFDQPILPSGQSDIFKGTYVILMFLVIFRKCTLAGSPSGGKGMINVGKKIMLQSNLKHKIIQDFDFTAGNLF